MKTGFKNLEDYINWTRINNDVNGNPRYVCHFLAFNIEGDKDIDSKYFNALQLAKELGGKKFHNKQFGGGIVFSTYNLRRLSNDILLLCGEAVEYKAKDGDSKIVLKRDVFNREGKLKKWFKHDVYGQIKTFSLVKNSLV